MRRTGISYTTTPSDESETNLQGVKQKSMSTQKLSEETKRNRNRNQCKKNKHLWFNALLKKNSWAVENIL